ncbi:MAG: 2-oxoglutarate dehydrogenase complex dihydrolipoyllysine-residue succinyltransferase [Candidatus Binatia bacterium]
MASEVRIPALGESIAEGVIVRWMKADGEVVRVDEALLELETDKASVEIPAERGGVLKILKGQGEKVQVGDVVARIDDAAAAASAPTPTPPAAEPSAALPPEPPRRAPAAPSPVLSPAVRRLVEEHALDPQAIPASGRGGRLTKEDVLAHLETTTRAPAAPPPVVEPPAATVPAPVAVPPRPPGADEERVPMTHLRQRIAQRLVEAQRTAAILTTFNEVDMSAVMDLRARHKARFSEIHGVSLGFMSFFARACIGALNDLPVANAAIDGTDVVYKKHVHLGVAVGTERGLVVPVVHEADRLSFAEIEQAIVRLATAARQGKLSLADLSGGTFTISNGGVYGSLLSTPILNPPQSAILGMHKIEKRAVVVDDQVVIRPMMYLALSYDHRLIDGEQAVTFLIRVKERIEDPTRMMLDI